MKHDMHVTPPITKIMPAIDAVRNHGGLMVTYAPDGQTLYGTPQGDVIHKRIAKELITLGHVKPVKSALFDDAQPQLYEAVIR